MNYLYRVGESNDVTFSDQNARLFSYKMFNTLTRLRVGRILTPEILLLDDHLGILMICGFAFFTLQVISASPLPILLIVFLPLEPLIDLLLEQALKTFVY